MPVVTGAPITVSLVGGFAGAGARIEVPVTRQIVSYWRPATLDGDVYSVTLDGVVAPGDYLVVWMDSFGGHEVFVPLHVVSPVDVARVGGPTFQPVDLSKVTPSPDDVAKLIRARTTEAGGGEAGTFTQDTHPTEVEAIKAIEDAADDVLASFASEFDPKHYRQVKRLVAIRAAILIEQSYYPENAGDSNVTLLSQLAGEISQGLATRMGVDLNEQNLLGVMEPRTPPTLPAPALNA